MNSLDYERTLFSLRELSYQDLLYIMYETKDDLLSEKIRRFVQALHLEKDLSKVERKHESLVSYLRHAYKHLNQEEENDIDIAFSELTQT